jgi:hypothetical protein
MPTEKQMAARACRTAKTPHNRSDGRSRSGAWHIPESARQERWYGGHLVGLRGRARPTLSPRPRSAVLMTRFGSGLTALEEDNNLALERTDYHSASWWS